MNFIWKGQKPEREEEAEKEPRLPEQEARRPGAGQGQSPYMEVER